MILFKKLYIFFFLKYLLYVSRLLHGVCRYGESMFAPGGSGGVGGRGRWGKEGIVSSFIFLPFLISHSHARPGMFLISVVNDREHLLSFVISDRLASLESPFARSQAGPCRPKGERVLIYG